MNHTRVAIIGSGPAGYTAGIYTSRAQLQPTLFAGIKSGGQLMWTTEVENFPGAFDASTDTAKAGPVLMMGLRAQAEKFGTTIEDKFVTAVDFSQRPFKLWTELPEGTSFETYETGSPDDVATLITATKKLPHSYTADAVIITTGAVSVMVGVPGEMQFFGRGVSTCAVCDAAFYRDKETYVIGGGDAAMEDTMALTKFAKSVTVIHRRDSFRASKIMQDRVLTNDKVKVLWNASLKEVKGDQKVTGIVVEQNGETKELPADGVFVAIGHRPVTDIFKGQIDLDAHGYVINRQSGDAAGVAAAQAALSSEGLVAFPTMTSVEGVFVAGDVADIRYKQAVTAAGQGCMAALDAERWLEREESL